MLRLYDVKWPLLYTRLYIPQTQIMNYLNNYKNFQQWNLK